MKYLLLFLLGCSSHEYEKEIDSACQKKLDQKDKALMMCALMLDNCNDGYKPPEELKERTYTW